MASCCGTGSSREESSLSLVFSVTDANVGLPIGVPEGCGCVRSGGLIRGRRRNEAENRCLRRRACDKGLDLRWRLGKAFGRPSGGGFAGFEAEWRIDIVADGHGGRRAVSAFLVRYLGISVSVVAASAHPALPSAAGQIPEFHDVVDTLLAWSTEILAFHDEGVGHISNGRLEGTNNKLQVLRRVAHGFVNRVNFEARGILVCPAVRPSVAAGFSGFSP